MIHCENIENKYKYDVELLASQLRNAELDFEDAVNSRREHQARIKELENKLSFVSQDNTVLKHRNPYVLVLVDGDGLIVSLHEEKRNHLWGNIPQGPPH
jgi:hypothetical protein